jgi:MFS family permease
MGGPVPSDLRIAQTPTALQRFGLLLLVCVIPATSYFAYELASITSGELKSQLHLTNQGLSFAFSSYALANSVVPLFAGVAYERMGVWNGLIVVAIIISIGVSVIAIGVQLKSYAVFIAGRFLYGLVGESTLVAVDILATDWFMFAELGLAMGLIQGAAQLGSFAAFYSVPAFIEFLGGFLAGPYWLSVGASSLAVVFLLIARHWERVAILEASAAIRKEIEQQTLQQKDSKVEEDREEDENVDEDGGQDPSELEEEPDDPEGNEDGMHEDGENADETNYHDHRKASEEEGGGERSQLLEVRNEEQTTAPTLKRRSPQQQMASIADVVSPSLSSSNGRKGKKTESSPLHLLRRALVPARLCATYLLTTRLAKFLGLHHLLRLKIDFFCVWFSIALYSALFYTYLAFGPDFFVSVFRLSVDDAGKIVGVVSISSAIVSPLSGLIMDKIGYRELAGFLGMAGSTVAFVFLGMNGERVTEPLADGSLPQGPAARSSYLPWVSLAAICYSILPSALYPLLPEFVPRPLFTQTYALVNASINACLVLSFTLAGRLSNNANAADAASLESIDQGAAATITTTTTGFDSNSNANTTSNNNYKGVFVMFVALAGAGTVSAGLLALRKCRRVLLTSKKKAGGRRRSSTQKPKPGEEPDHTGEVVVVEEQETGIKEAGEALLPSSSVADVARLSPLRRRPAAGGSSTPASPSTIKINVAPPTSPSIPAPTSTSLPLAGSAAPPLPSTAAHHYTRRIRSASAGVSTSANVVPVWAVHRVFLPPPSIAGSTLLAGHHHHHHHPGSVIRTRPSNNKRSAPIPIVGGGGAGTGSSNRSNAGTAAASGSVSFAPLPSHFATSSSASASASSSSGDAAAAVMMTSSSWHGAGAGGSGDSGDYRRQQLPSSSSCRPPAFPLPLPTGHVATRQQQQQQRLHRPPPHPAVAAGRLYAGSISGGSISGGAGALIISAMAAKEQQQQQQQQQQQRRRQHHDEEEEESGAASSSSSSLSHWSSPWLGLVGLGGRTVRGQGGKGGTSTRTSSTSSSSSAVISGTATVSRPVAGPVIAALNNVAAGTTPTTTVLSPPPLAALHQRLLSSPQQQTDGISGSLSPPPNGYLPLLPPSAAGGGAGSSSNSTTTGGETRHFFPTSSSTTTMGGVDVSGSHPTSPSGLRRLLAASSSTDNTAAAVNDVNRRERQTAGGTGIVDIDCESENGREGGYRYVHLTSGDGSSGPSSSTSS